MHSSCWAFVVGHLEYFFTTLSSKKSRSNSTDETFSLRNFSKLKLIRSENLGWYFNLPTNTRRYKPLAKVRSRLCNFPGGSSVHQYFLYRLTVSFCSNCFTVLPSNWWRFRRTSLFLMTVSFERLIVSPWTTKALPFCAKTELQMQFVNSKKKMKAKIACRVIVKLFRHRSQ